MKVDFPDAPVVDQILALPPRSWQWDGTRWRRLPDDAPIPLEEVPRCGRLIPGTSNPMLVPYNGDQIKINGRMYQIPPGGMGCTSTESAPSYPALFFVYAEEEEQVSPSRFAIYGRLASHITDERLGDNYGVEVMIGDTTKTLVGMFRMMSPTSEPWGLDTPQQRFVASWFNRLGKTLAVDTNGSVTINGEIGGRAELLWWYEREDDVYKAVHNIAYSIIGQWIVGGELSGDAIAYRLFNDPLYLVSPPVVETELNQWTPLSINGGVGPIPGDVHVVEGYNFLGLWVELAFATSAQTRDCGLIGAVVQ